MITQPKRDYLITPITAADTLPIRHRVMWPDKPLDFVKLPDDDKGSHFGLYVEDSLISVLSLFIEGHSAQFRKFATLQSHQGKGYGTLLLNHVILEATKRGAIEIWCNARTEKAAYYSSFGLEQTSEPTYKEGKSFIIMTKKLNPASVSDSFT